MDTTFTYWDNQGNCWKTLPDGTLLKTGGPLSNPIDEPYPHTIMGRSVPFDVMSPLPPHRPHWYEHGEWIWRPPSSPQPSETADSTAETTIHLGGSSQEYVRTYFQPETICEEAQRLTTTQRQEDYGHPLDDYTRTAELWTALLRHKLVEGETITYQDALRCMCAVKLSRDVHAPKRDNRTDLAGYAQCLQFADEESAAREEEAEARGDT